MFYWQIVDKLRPKEVVAKSIQQFRSQEVAWANFCQINTGFRPQVNLAIQAQRKKDAERDLEKTEKKSDNIIKPAWH